VYWVGDIVSVIWWLDEQFLGKEELICKTECHVCEYVSNIRTHCATGYCEGKKQIWNIRQLIVCNEFWDSWRGKNMLEVLGKKKGKIILTASKNHCFYRPELCRERVPCTVYNVPLEICSMFLKGSNSPGNISG